MAPTQNAGEEASSKRQLVSSWREDEILSVFKQTPECKPNGNSVTGFAFPVEHPIVYVKFCYPPARGMAEAKNYDYAFRALKAMPPNQTQGIFIPEIYRTFQNDDTFFIIMDYIPGRTLAQLQEQQDWDSKKETCINDIARAIRLLMSIQPPPGQKPGPVGGGHIRHPLFKDDISFCEYSSVEELEKHLNKVCNHEGPLSDPLLTHISPRFPLSKTRLPQQCPLRRIYVFITATSSLATSFSLLLVTSTLSTLTRLGFCLLALCLLLWPKAAGHLGFGSKTY